jgi:polo-like kinase 1
MARVVVQEYTTSPNATPARYLRGKLLGRGGFAAVYELKDMTAGKLWAGKVVSLTLITQSATKRHQLDSEISIHR